MGQMFVVTLREGIEAFLIIAITIAYLRKTGRERFLPAVWAGVAAAAALSMMMGTVLSDYSAQPFWEGVLAAVAATLIISMVIYMMRAARLMKTQIASRIEQATTQAGFAAQAGIFLFVLLMITREGMEMALITATLATDTGSGNLLAGSLLGIATAFALSWAWSRYGHRINLGLFFQVTSVFLMLFAIQLVIYSFHEFTEAAILPIDNTFWHIATEPYGPEGEYGHWLSYGLILVPAVWLLLAALRRNSAPPARAA